jgi:Na+-translocating ferredoxin:NAD+ oxidoreductase RnfD subunit
VDYLRDALLVLHFVGFGALFGGALVQVRDDVKVVNHAMLDGALTQLVSGLLLVGVIEGVGDDVNHAKIGVKLVVALVIAVLCWVNRRKPAVPNGLFFAILLLTVANVVIAVFW